MVLSDPASTSQQNPQRAVQLIFLSAGRNIRIICVYLQKSRAVPMRHHTRKRRKKP